jgi:hypothetical protein
MSAQIIDLKMQVPAERQQPGAAVSVDAILNGLPPELVKDLSRDHPGHDQVPKRRGPPKGLGRQYRLILTQLSQLGRRFWNFVGES